jgi:hypothetical protein
MIPHKDTQAMAVRFVNQFYVLFKGKVARESAIFGP